MFHLDHVQVAIPADGEPLADSFYVDLLGFQVETKPPRLAVRGGRWYRHGSAALHLGVDPDFRPATKAHPAFVVDNYDELLSRLRAHAVAVRENEEVDGVERCHVDDPFGNRLELIRGS